HRSTSKQCPLYPQKRTLLTRRGMSALCQKRTFCAAAKVTLFDHLVGAGEQRGWHGDSECFGRGEVYDKIEFGRLLDWNFGWLRSTQNLIDEIGGARPHMWPVWPIRH